MKVDGKKHGRGFEKPPFFFFFFFFFATCEAFLLLLPPPSRLPPPAIARFGPRPHPTYLQEKKRCSASLPLTPCNRPEIEWESGDSGSKPRVQMAEARVRALTARKGEKVICIMVESFPPFLHLSYLKFSRLRRLASRQKEGKTRFVQANLALMISSSPFPMRAQTGKVGGEGRGSLGYRTV